MMTARTYESLLNEAARLEPTSMLVIDGRLLPAASGEVFDCVSPRDGSVITRVASGDEPDIDAAVRSARAAFEDGRWAHQSPTWRRRTLQRLARLVEEHAAELALLETLDMGKPITAALDCDIPAVIRVIDYYAEALDKIYGEVAPTGMDSVATVTREPIGVVGAVVPWNFPLLMAVWKIAPAIAVGNSIVVKPAEQSPLSVLRLAQLALEAGIPPGVLNVVPGFGPTAGAALGRHPDVDAVTFTGSGPIGRKFLEYSASSNLKQVSLELGGKSPHVVLADAPDVATVAEAVARGIFFNQGEVCSAGSRLLVHRSRKDELVEEVVRLARARRVGDPLDPSTEVGALVGEEHLQKVMSAIHDAVAGGARTLAGGSRILVETGGFYVEPTVLDNIQPSDQIAQTEVFGPVLAVIEFDTIDEAIRIANGTQYGLAAAVWTTDLSHAHRVSRAMRAGTVWVNCFDESDVRVPFGGYKQSGFGRDNSLHALDKYTQLKTTWIKL